MNRPKMLPSSMRRKKRYLAFEIISEERVDFPDIVPEFWSAMVSLLGELGTSKTNIWFVKDSWDGDTQTGFVRCDHMYTEHVRASLALVKSIKDKRCIVHTLGISGTMKGARSKFLGEHDE